MWPFTTNVRRNAWTAPPARPSRYPLHQRLFDQLAGYRDGRWGLPCVEPFATGMSPGGERHHVGTPKLEELRRTARTQMELERLASEEDCAAIVDARDEAGALAFVERAEEHAARLARLTADSAELPSDTALGARRFAEAQHPETLIRARRSADHARSRNALEAEYDSACKAVSEARRAAAEIAKLLEAKRAAARIRARHLHEHAWRRVAVYWRQLVRSHPDGAVLNDRLKPVGPDLPDWAREPDPAREKAS